MNTSLIISSIASATGASTHNAHLMAERPNAFQPINLSELLGVQNSQAEPDSFLSPLVKSAIFSHVGCLSMVLRNTVKKKGYSAGDIDFSYAVCYERTGRPKTVNINVTSKSIDEAVFTDLVQQAHLSVPCQQALGKIPLKVHAYAA